MSVSLIQVTPLNTEVPWALGVESILTPEIIPGKHSDTRIKPLPLTNGHGRYITAAPGWTLVSVGGMAVTYQWR
jgi:hypothetical protein